MICTMPICQMNYICFMFEQHGVVLLPLSFVKEFLAKLSFPKLSLDQESHRHHSHVLIIAGAASEICFPILLCRVTLNFSISTN